MGEPRRTHQLKTWPEYFQAVHEGRKRFEVRVNDRDYRVGDRLELQEYVPGLDGGFTGAECDVDVTYILPGNVFGLSDKHVVMSIELARSEGPHPEQIAENANCSSTGESGGAVEFAELVDDLMQGFADPYVNSLTLRAAKEIARLDALLGSVQLQLNAMIAASPPPLKGEALPVVEPVVTDALSREEVARALEFYADPISYIKTQTREPCTAVAGDNGQKARAALALLSRGEA